MRLRIVLISLAAVVLGLVLLSQFAPVLARHRLITAVQNGCGGCEFTIDRLALHVLPSRVVAEGVRYHSNPDEFVELSFDLERVEGRLAFLPLLTGTWRIEDAVAARPSFTAIEKDPKPDTPPPPRPFPSNLPPLSLARIAVHDGSFTYVHRTRTGDAPIHVTQVDGVGTHFASRTDMGPTDTAFEVTSHLEKSGEATIRAAFDLLAAANDDHVEIELAHQALSDLDPYFVTDGGIRLKGVVDHAKATMNIRSGVLTGELTGRYRSLEVRHEKKTLKTLLSDVLHKVTIHKTQEQPVPPEASFRVARPPDESIVKFLLSGLKPAAHKILSRVD